MNAFSAYVYILASRKNGTLYIGVTNNLVRRVWEHKSKRMPGFTKDYYITRLVYYECFDDITDAIHREKCLKKYKREWKIHLIEEKNLFWRDLYPEICL